MSIPGNKARIALLVSPNAARNEVLNFTGGVLRVKVAAPPTRGKANREVIAFLCQLLGVGKSSIDIIRGDTSRHKLIAIDGLSLEEVKKRLSSREKP